ncbi:hypothetical protein [Arthrobacter cupressi]|uniref:Flp pilus assembly protein TadG n=1 Tax=Arthrobacter cupressi TaxID=1045773 RepID=A0A1G8YKZ2_9MICC|nr:hypothetical protein [Arthrobacter cupressi]NYD76662.1 Flp pilus assembly protein TadG [Arthrobacter cupressi]SDK03542.1 hypothetical protein SAMN05216555_1267 [Arthrobacter cupressi]
MRHFPAELAQRFASRLRVSLCRPRPGDAALPDHAREGGSAVVEFTFLALLLMVPLVYFIVTVGQLQGGAFAVVGAADQAAKVFVAQEDAGRARAAAEQSAALTLADYGHPVERATVDISCDRADCMSAGATVTVTVNLTVPLPMVPFGDSLRLDAGRLNASASQLVGRFR